jgi:hypothetical protein
MHPQIAVAPARTPAARSRPEAEALDLTTGQRAATGFDAGSDRRRGTAILVAVLGVVAIGLVAVGLRVWQSNDDNATASGSSADPGDLAVPVASEPAPLAAPSAATAPSAALGAGQSAAGSDRAGTGSPTAAPTSSAGVPTDEAPAAKPATRPRAGERAGTGGSTPPAAGSKKVPVVKQEDQPPTNWSF